MAGTWTTNNYLFIPPPGSEYDEQFTTAFERTDSQLHLLSQVQSFYRLRVTNNALTPATKIDITADAVTVSSAGGTPYILRNFSKTVNCGTAGADGLDTGVLATGWYYFYCIAKADGTMAGLASTSATTPTMPTDYVYKKLVGSIYYTDTPGTFLPIKQFNQVVYISNGGAALFGTTGATWTSNDCSTVIPSNAISVMVQPYSVGDFDIGFKIAWDASGTNLLVLTIAKSGLYSGTPPAWDAVDGSPFVYLLNPDAPQTIFSYAYDGNTRGGLNCLGYELDI